MTAVTPPSNHTTQITPTAAATTPASSAETAKRQGWNRSRMMSRRKMAKVPIAALSATTTTTSEYPLS